MSLPRTSPAAEDLPLDPTTIRKKRRRGPVACYPCRERKRKCDALRPVCASCIAGDWPCHWPEVDKRRRQFKKVRAGREAGSAGGAGRKSRSRSRSGSGSSDGEREQETTIGRDPAGTGVHQQHRTGSVGTKGLARHDSSSFVRDQIRADPGRETRFTDNDITTTSTTRSFSSSFGVADDGSQSHSQPHQLFLPSTSTSHSRSPPTDGTGRFSALLNPMVLHSSTHLDDHRPASYQSGSESQSGQQLQSHAEHYNYHHRHLQAPTGSQRPAFNDNSHDNDTDYPLNSHSALNLDPNMNMNMNSNLNMNSAYSAAEK
ncbi:hypothetical protein FFLO_06705 [Filobasidium floriforme]|uniref:Zn(2)-C6 fungal-type domain-containing protein n=1 Tax=Filobasidium floriforme TaxID=5210 RepID=A0A8K0JGB4_9TREE|nr:hypothetical protein FFLO_06705 [Filobasidium floriforme]